MDTTPLDEVAAAFDHWRATRSKRAPIPKALIAQVLELPSTCKKAEITRRLGINHSTLNRWKGKPPPEDNTFITLPITEAAQAPSTNNNPLDITIKLTNGTQITLTGAASKAAAFIGELQQRGAL